MIINNEILFRLSCHYPKSYQEYAIEYIIANSDKLTDEDIETLIERGCKDTYQNTIKVFSILGYPKVAKAIPSLFMLFQDLNWPGSTDAMNLLSALPLDAYKDDLNMAIKKALDTSDDDWIYGIRTFIENENISEAIDKDFKEKFNEAYQRYIG